MLTSKSKTDDNLNAVYGINGKGLDRSQDTVVVKETKSATEAETTGSLGKYSSKIFHLTIIILNILIHFVK